MSVAVERPSALARLARAYLALMLFARDWYAIAILISLPFSATVTIIVLALWFVIVLPTLDWRDLVREARAPRSLFPILLVAMTLIGIAWSEGARADIAFWVGATAKLVAIPILIVQFRASSKGPLVLAAGLLALVPVVVLAIVSALSDPREGPYLLGTAMVMAGVPFKDYIAQSGFLSLGMFALAHVGLDAWARGNRAGAFAALGAAVVALLVIVFVATSRTALAVLPVLGILFAAQRLGWRRGAIVAVIGALVVSLAWVSSAPLRARVTAIVTEVHLYRTTGAATSSGLRLEWWQRSIARISEAPLLGHGTGSIAVVMNRGHESATAAQADRVSQPHNQLFTQGLQLGAVGMLLLVAMWAAHLAALRGPGLATWIGTGLVVQTIASSLFNSHITDFAQGWTYVVGVGIAIGLALRRRDLEAARPPPRA